jgi:integrase
MGRQRASAKTKKLPPRFHLKNGKYWHVSKGKKRRWSDLGSDVTKALSAYRSLESTQPLSESVSYLIDEFLGTYPQGTTLINYKSRAKRLKKVFGHLHPDAITSADIGKYLDNHPYPYAANFEIRLLTLVYKRAVRHGKAKYNPCIGVEMLKLKKRDKLISDAEWRVVYEAMPEWIQCMMDIGYITSLREGDLLALKDEDAVRADVVQIKTGNKQRYQLTQVLEDAIARARAVKRVPSEWLFPNDEGRRLTPNAFRQHWHRYKKDLPVSDFHFHDIRARSLTDADSEEGMNPQHLAGHDDPRTTKGYIKTRKIIQVVPHKRKIG